VAPRGSLKSRHEVASSIPAFVILDRPSRQGTRAEAAQEGVMISRFKGLKKAGNSEAKAASMTLVHR